MPIRPENRTRYPKNWKQISHDIRFIRAEFRCECTGECGGEHVGRCHATHDRQHPETRSRVVLTVAHLDHTPENCDPDNLKAMCQACHLRYDQAEHALNASHTRAEKRATGMAPLFDLP